VFNARKFPTSSKPRKTGHRGGHIGEIFGSLIRLATTDWTVFTLVMIVALGWKAVAYSKPPDEQLASSTTFPDPLSGDLIQNCCNSSTDLALVESETPMIPTAEPRPIATPHAFSPLRSLGLRSRASTDDVVLYFVCLVVSATAFCLGKILT